MTARIMKIKGPAPPLFTAYTYLSGAIQWEKSRFMWGEADQVVQ